MPNIHNLPTSILCLLFQLFYGRQRLLTLSGVCKAWYKIVTTCSDAWIVQTPTQKHFEIEKFISLSEKQIKAFESSKNFIQSALLLTLTSQDTKPVSNFLARSFSKLKYLTIFIPFDNSVKDLESFLFQVAKNHFIQYLYLMNPGDWQKFAVINEFSTLRFLSITFVNIQQQDDLRSILTIEPGTAQKSLNRLKTLVVDGSTKNTFDFRNRQLLPSIQHFQFTSFALQLNSTQSTFLTSNVVAISWNTKPQSTVKSFLEILAEAPNLRFLNLFNLSLQKKEFANITETFKLEKLTFGLMVDFRFDWNPLLNLKNSLKLFQYASYLNRPLLEVLTKITSLQCIIVKSDPNPDTATDAVCAFSKMRNLNLFYLPIDKKYIQEELQFRARLYDWEKLKLKVFEDFLETKYTTDLERIENKKYHFVEMRHCIE